MGKAQKKTPRRPLPAPAGWAGIAILLAAAIVPYLDSLWGSYHFDDDSQIPRNESIRSWPGLLSVRPVNRWLTFATFFVNYQLHGLKFMPGWHALNILLHAGCVLALYWVLRRMLTARGQGAGPLSFYAALLFAVHPLASEPVNYIQARSVLLYALFSLLAVGGAIVAHQEKGWPAKAKGLGLLAASIVLAALSKEVGLFFAPAMAGLYAVIFILPGARKWSGRRLLVGSGVCVLAVLVLVGGVCWLKYSGALASMAARLNLSTAHGRGMFASHFWAQVTVFWRYVGLAALPLPLRLNVDHYVPTYAFSMRAEQPYVLLSPQVLVAAAGLAVIAGLAVWQWRKRPHLTFLLLAVPLGLAPYFVMSSPEMMVEYRFYLPLAGFCALAAMGMLRVLRGGGHSGAALVAALCLALAGCAALRNLAWRTNVTLWEDAVRKDPYKARAVNGLAWALATDPDHPQPVRALELALKSLSYDPRIMNMAWTLAQDPRNEPLRQAMSSMKPGVLYVTPWPGKFNPAMVDTLAEAYYANGMYDQAILVEQNNLADVEQLGETAFREFFQEQLAKYAAARDAKRNSSTTITSGASAPTTSR